VLFKITYFFTLVLSIVNILQAEEIKPVTFSCKQNIKIDNSILENVQQEYTKVNDLIANFTQTSYLAALDIAEQSKGSLIYKKPGKMVWHYKLPEEQFFHIDNNMTWFYQVQDQQVLVNKLDKVLLSDLPIGFLLGINEVNKIFNLTKVCNTTIKSYPLSLKLLLLELTSKKQDKGSELEKFELLINQNTFLPMGAKIIDIAGNTTTILFSELKTNQNLKDQDFSRNFPLGVDIINSE
jgi:outer membrane lipoprotein carrier protein